MNNHSAHKDAKVTSSASGSGRRFEAADILLNASATTLVLLDGTCLENRKPLCTLASLSHVHLLLRE